MYITYITYMCILIDPAIQAYSLALQGYIALHLQLHYIRFHYVLMYMYIEY